MTLRGHYRMDEARIVFRQYPPVAPDGYLGSPEHRLQQQYLAETAALVMADPEATKAVIDANGRFHDDNR